MIKKEINKNKILSILLAFTILLTNFSLTAYAIDDNYNTSYFFEETNNGFILRYEQVEDNKIVYYDEEVKGNVLNTKKYNKDDGELKFLEEFNTIIEQKDNGTIIATTQNITKNTVETLVIGTEDESNIQLRSRTYHPFHSDYYLSHASTGHLGLSNLTMAGITFAVGNFITGGSLVMGTLAGIVTGVMAGGWSNLYYRTETYAPEGTGPGRPLWKKIVKYYYDVNRTNQAGSTLYYDADILTKI